MVNVLEKTPDGERFLWPMVEKGQCYRALSLIESGWVRRMDCSPLGLISLNVYLSPPFHLFWLRAFGSPSTTVHPGKWVTSAKVKNVLLLAKTRDLELTLGRTGPYPQQVVFEVNLLFDAKNYHCPGKTPAGVWKKKPKWKRKPPF